MVKRVVAAILSVIIVFVLQCTLGKAIALASISPNLLIILTSTIGFVRGRKEGAAVGALSGLLIDIFYCDVFGVNALIFMYVGYINGIFKKNFLPEDVRLPLLLIGASDLIYSGAMFAFRFMLRNKLNLYYYLPSIIIPELIYTVLVSIIMYRLILFVCTKFDKMEKRSPKKFV